MFTRYMLPTNLQQKNVLIYFTVTLSLHLGGLRSIVMSMSICLSACITQKLHGQISPNFCACCLWQWLGPLLTALQYVMYF